MKPAGCPRVSFPGRAFPVKTFHLEDALELVRHRVDGSADWSRSSMAAQRRATRKAGENGPPPVPTQQEYSRRFPKHGDGVCSALAALDTEAINVQLIVELVTWYVSCGGGVEAAMDTLKNRRKPEGYRGESKGSAVLVFLPVLIPFSVPAPRDSPRFRSTDTAFKNEPAQAAATNRNQPQRASRPQLPKLPKPLNIYVYFYGHSPLR